MSEESLISIRNLHATAGEAEILKGIDLDRLDERDCGAIVKPVGLDANKAPVIRPVDSVAGTVDRERRKAELLLDEAEVVAVMGVVPIVERQSHPPLHVALLDARRRVHPDRALMPHPDAAVDVARHVVGVTGRPRKTTVDLA